MSLSAYEELVERTRALLFEARRNAADEFTDRAYAKTLLTSILRTLETVTREMQEIGENTEIGHSWGPGGEYTYTPERIWDAMLHASLLERPK